MGLLVEERKAAGARIKTLASGVGLINGEESVGCGRRVDEEVTRLLDLVVQDRKLFRGFKCALQTISG